MAKKDSHIRSVDVSLYHDTKNVKEANIADLSTENMKIYGANINLARVFPEVHDG